MVEAEWELEQPLPAGSRGGSHTEEGFSGGGRKVSGSSGVLVPAGDMGGHPCLTSPANRDKLMRQPHF